MNVTDLVLAWCSGAAAVSALVAALIGSRGCAVFNAAVSLWVLWMAVA